MFQFSSVPSLSRVRLFATPWTAACQASLSITNSRSSLKLMSITSVMPSNHLILCRPLLLPPSIFPSIRVFSNESVLRIRWPKYRSFTFSISPSDEYSGLISFRMDCSILIHPHVLVATLWYQQTKWQSEAAQSGPTHCDSMDYSTRDSSVHGIFRARVLEWAAISFSRGSSGPRDQTQVSHIVGRCSTIWTTRVVRYLQTIVYDICCDQRQKSRVDLKTTPFGPGCSISREAWTQSHHPSPGSPI